MEPALPGRPGQPPWSLGLHPSPYLAVGLTAAALAAGTLGLVLVLRAVRGGWSVPARAVLVAGLLAAVALTLVPPFGSSDHLSYAAYGRMLVTGHNPYTTTPAQLAALGDPIARAVQDWAAVPVGLRSARDRDPGAGRAGRRDLGAAHRVRARPGQPGRLRRHRAAAAPDDPREPGAAAARGPAVGGQPAAAPGARGRRARGQPGGRVRRRGRGGDVLGQGGRRPSGGARARRRWPGRWSVWDSRSRSRSPWSGWGSRWPWCSGPASLGRCGGASWVRRWRVSPPGSR